MPKVREGDFYPASLEKGLRSERALKLALAEMYVQGVSTRKVAAITEQLCGFAVTASAVSRAAQALDEQLQAWRERPLDAYAYVYLDARYENDLDDEWQVGRRYFSQASMKRLLVPDKLAPSTGILIPLAPIH